jgi:hypothetical protein
VLAALIQGASATVLTAESFDAEALHPTRSAFVLFYAPWCDLHTPCAPLALRRAAATPPPPAPLCTHHARLACAATVRR